MAYYSEEIAKLAKSKDIKMVPTNLVGRSKKSNCERFEINEKRHMVKRCPSGHKPITSTFKKGSYKAHFNKGQCNNCPLREDCPIVKQKKRYLFVVSETKLHRSQLIAKMGTSGVLKVSQKRSRNRGYSLHTKKEVLDRLSPGKGIRTFKGLLV